MVDKLFAEPAQSQYEKLRKEQQRKEQQRKRNFVKLALLIAHRHSSGPFEPVTDEAADRFIGQFEQYYGELDI